MSEHEEIIQKLETVSIAVESFRYDMDGLDAQMAILMEMMQHVLEALKSMGCENERPGN